MNEPAILHGLMHGPASYRLIQLKVELSPAWVPPLLRCGQIYSNNIRRILYKYHKTIWLPTPLFGSRNELASKEYRFR